MWRSACACAILFLVGCQRVPSVSGVASTPSVDAGAPATGAGAAPDDPATGVTARDAGVDGGGLGAGDIDGGAPASDMAYFCSNMIDPGTHDAVALRGDDRELFYIAGFANDQPRELRAVAKDGSSPWRTVAVAGTQTSMGWDIALDGTDVYFENGYKIWRVPKAGGTPVLVYQVPYGGTDSPTYAMYQLVVDATNLYWRHETGYGSPAVSYMPKSGGAVQSIGGDASRIVVVGGTLYGGYIRELWAAPVGAGGTSFGLSRAVASGVLTADATRMIFVSGDGTIDAATSDGAVTTLASWSGAVYGSATFGGVVYFSDDKSVYRIDGGAAHAIYTPRIGGVGSDLVVDDAFVYTQTWCNIARIQR
jgi:hypothetical protein